MIRIQYVTMIMIITRKRGRRGERRRRGREGERYNKRRRKMIRWRDMGRGQCIMTK